MLPVEANGQPAVAAYVDGRAHSIQVFEITGPAIAHIAAFYDPGRFAGFGLGSNLPR